MLLDIVKKREPLLVHCKMARNRSATIASVILCMLADIDLWDAVEVVRGQSGDIREPDFDEAKSVLASLTRETN